MQSVFNRLSLILAVGLLLQGCGGQKSFDYPDSNPDPDVIDDYHGTKVTDPYRWMENLESEKLDSWIAAQNEITMPYLENLPGRDRFKDRLTELWDYPKYGVPEKQAGSYFFRYNDGLQNQSVLMKSESLDEEPVVLLDPNQLSEDGTVALTGYEVSPDGRRLAYSISRSGSDWREFYVRDIRSGRDLRDQLKWIKFSSMTWTSTSNGFYYARYPEPKKGKKLEAENKNMKVYYHKVGTSQSRDELIYERPDQPDWGFAPEMTEDGRYLTLTVWQGTDPRNRFFYRPMFGSRQVVELLDDFDAMYSFINNEGETFYFHTNLDAPKGRIIAIDISNPERENWTEIVPEQEETLQSATIAGNRLVLRYLKDASSDLRLYSLSGDFEKNVELPSLGTVGAFSGSRDETEAFYSFSSFTYPTSIYRYNFESGNSQVYKSPDVDFDPEDYITRQVFYESEDGTEIPMFIVHHKNVKVRGQDYLSFNERMELKREGNHPTLLYGYGGFNISLTPRFNVGNLVWMEQGGIYAQANLRGGGEYGEAWHKAGTKENKQNVFDDFIAAAEYLIDEEYTSPQSLAIEGGSNGGLLVGACITQRPDLFAAALPAVGVMDMLRYHKFTIGWAWASDYGRSDNPEAFEYLYDYSPLHNIEVGESYPATLVTTADHDDRVVPSHSFKFIATLQAAHEGSDPVLIRIETKAGHGAGKPTEKIIAEEADKMSFAAKHTGLEIESD